MSGDENTTDFRIDFDMMVTGQLMHEVLRLEQDVNGIISDFFVTESLRKPHFDRAVLHRECLSFQDKIEILRCLMPVWGPEADKVRLKDILSRIEELKDLRNAMAHGCDVSDHTTADRILRIGMVSRSGKQKIKEITPESHLEMMEQAGTLSRELSAAREHLRKCFVRNS